MNAKAATMSAENAKMSARLATMNANSRYGGPMFCPLFPSSGPAQHCAGGSRGSRETCHFCVADKSVIFDDNAL